MLETGISFSMRATKALALLYSAISNQISHMLILTLDLFGIESPCTDSNNDFTLRYLIGVLHSYTRGKAGTE